MERLIDDGPREPGFQRAITSVFKSMYLRENPDERFLKHVMEVFRISDISRAYSGEKVCILIIEHIHGAGVAFGKKAYDMLLFIVSW